jgi:hypothetical protein
MQFDPKIYRMDPFWHTLGALIFLPGVKKDYFSFPIYVTKLVPKKRNL